jgi:hypothetical protein
VFWRHQSDDNKITTLLRQKYFWISAKYPCVEPAQDYLVVPLTPVSAMRLARDPQPDDAEALNSRQGAKEMRGESRHFDD